MLKAVRYRAAFFCLAVCFAGFAQENADELYREGMKLLSEHRPEEALATFRRAVELRPRDAQSWAAIGVVQASRGDYARAEEPFRRACELNPGLPDACRYYGRILYLEDRFDAALSVLRKLPERDYRIEALCLEGLGRNSEAEVAFQKAVAAPRGSNPNEDPGIDFGVFLYRQGRTEDALGPLRGAVGRHPDSSRGHLELGCTLLALGRAEEAAEELARAVALDPSSERGKILLGKARAQVGLKKEN